MKAISILQPWASLIAAGHKTIETRSWRTDHRGLLAIHAGKRDHECLARWNEEPFRSVLYSMGARAPRDLPYGAIIAVAELIAVRPVEHLDPSPLERAFGDYRPGRFGWRLRIVQRLDPVIPMPGRRNLWSVPNQLFTESLPLFS